MEIADGKLHDLALNFTPGVGAFTLRNLVKYFGSSKAVLEASEEHLNTIAGMDNATISALKNNRSLIYDRAEKEMAFARKHAIQILTLSEKNYPKRLKECDDAPSVLYYRGNADLNACRIVSVVGSRRATQYGKNTCRDFVEALSDYNVLVVSGLSYGVDSHAHQASVDHQVPTVGVLGHGLDQIYPPVHRSLAKEMLKAGGLVTEFPSRSRPKQQNFPQRNRIIAGLADVVIVVETEIQGSTMITADIANHYNRDVCAFPGNIYQKSSAGCNFLIKSHRAHLISRAKDLEYLMNWGRANAR